MAKRTQIYYRGVIYLKKRYSLQRLETHDTIYERAFFESPFAVLNTPPGAGAFFGGVQPLNWAAKFLPPTS